MCAQCLKNIYHLHDSNKFFFSNIYFNIKVTIRSLQFKFITLATLLNEHRRTNAFKLWC